MPGVAPKISVVLPFFNAERTLSDALQSIADQEFNDWECVMVNNNSRDTGRDIAVEWEQRDLRFRLVDETRQGVMFASNTGCEVARGTYLARMDADDLARPCRLRVQSEFLDSHKDYGAVGGLVTHRGDPLTTGGFRRFVEWSNSVITYEEIFNRRFIEAPIVNPTAMWRRETSGRHGLYRSGDFPEDYEMWLRWLHQGVRIGKVPEVVLDWNDSPGRLTRTHPIYSDRAFFEIKSHYLAKWLSEHNPYHPAVWVWGASRISRRRARILEAKGIRIDTYIDTKKSRQLDRKLLYYEDLPEAGSGFILTYIRQMDNREKIQAFLELRGYTEGKDYLLVS
ncbi:MAG: glycosyltransferase family 2 protein [Bacteroidales bacterium]|nr:glycosyltransferase family 2 protein [Bacteroidales bacterium]